MKCMIPIMSDSKNLIASVFRCRLMREARDVGAKTLTPEEWNG